MYNFSKTSRTLPFTPLLFLFLLPFLIATCIGYADSENAFAVLYKGRFRPPEAYARLWLYDHYHAPKLKKEDLTAFKTDSKDPLQLLWSLEMKGYQPYEEVPLFWIGSAELKRALQLPLRRDRFSYRELSHKNLPPFANKNIEETGASLLASLKTFARLEQATSRQADLYVERRNVLVAAGRKPKEVSLQLEQEYPFIQRLQNAGVLFKVLPGRYRDGEWFPLQAVNILIASPSTSELEEASNFTRFSDAHFQAIRTAYHSLQQAYAKGDQKEMRKRQHELSHTLSDAYEEIAGTVIQQAHGKQITAPTPAQLNIESLYVRLPWIPLLILLYSSASLMLLISYKLDWKKGDLIAFSLLLVAISCHTALLAMRCFILDRPPVSNMFETVLYVPWIAVCASLLFPSFRQNPTALFAACATSIGLLILLEVSDLNQNLDQVQAVLDSQFWLLIHVLLVVGSYGLFILGGVLGHVYLGLLLVNKLGEKTKNMLASMILQTMYGGTAMLIIGTILGGIWAAQSWGRFWDWDPKESWAFISCAFYLLWIHAYRFKKIASFGLAFGAVSGLVIISFTWYGVNYILGTGLHSYGFGSGGEIYYYVFVLGECLLLGTSLLRIHHPSGKQL